MKAKSKTPKPFACKKCPAKYATKHTLDNHKCMQCNICKKYFITPFRLKKHYSDEHGKSYDKEMAKSENVFPFECNNLDCSKGFKTYHNLKKHIESVHFITCKICNERYRAVKKTVQFKFYGKHICRYGNLSIECTSP